MPFVLSQTDCSPLVIDYEYEIQNKPLLAEYVGQLLLGHHYHVMKILNSLATQPPSTPDLSIDQVIAKLKIDDTDKRDGWLFQMISWIVLAKRNTGENFYSNTPQFAPAQHGIDGLAIVLDERNMLRSIIITEDKCTTVPRGKITQQVFPEFRAFENSEKDNALVGVISTLLANLDSGKILEQVQNNIYDPKLRIYRIGITRELRHNDVEGRQSLFRNYDDNVRGEIPMRRSAASIFFENLRPWMEDFASMVIQYLESKKSSHVQQ